MLVLSLPYPQAPLSHIADRLRSTTAMEKTISDKFDEFSTRLLQMQDHIQESLLESRQVRQSQQDLSDRVAASFGTEDRQCPCKSHC